MKKILFVFFILIVFVVIALAVFIFSFDVNRYRTDIAAKITEQTGYPVDIGSIHLTLNRGLALQINDFSIKGKLQSGPAAFQFSTKRFFLNLELSPLLHKEIRIRNVVIESPVLIYKNDAEEIQGAPLQQFPLQTASKQEDANYPKVKKAPPFSITQFEISKITFQDGTFRYEDNNRRVALVFGVEHIQLVIEHLSLVAPVQFQGSADIDFGSVQRFNLNGTFSYPEQTVRATAEYGSAVKLVLQANQLFNGASSRVDIGFNQLDLASFYGNTQRNQEYFAGSLSGNVSLNAGGFGASELAKSLSGIGKLQIEKGALKNKNLVRENLEKITQIPGVGLLFQTDLGPRFEALLNSPDTVFDLMKLDFRVDTWKVFIDLLEITHQDFAIFTSGMYFLRGPIDLSGSLTLRSELSDALMHKVRELAWIADPQGQLVIPFMIKGKQPDIAVTPNLSNLAQRTIENVGTELLNQALDSWLKPKDPQSQDQPQQP